MLIILRCFMDYLQGNYRDLLQYVNQHDVQNRPEESTFYLSGLMPELRILQGKIEYEKNQASEKEIVNYQDLSKKTQDLANRVEIICSGKEPPDHGFNFANLRNTVINENAAREHFNRIADQIGLLQNLLFRLSSFPPDERKNEVAKIREKLNQLWTWANLSDSYKDIQNQIVESKAKELSNKLLPYEIAERDLDKINTELQSIESRYHALAIEHLGLQPTPGPPSEISISDRGVTLLKELSDQHNKLVDLFSKYPKYFGKEELASLDQTFHTIQEYCEGMLHEMGIQFKVPNRYEEMMDKLDTFASHEYNDIYNLEMIKKSELSFAQLLYPDSEQVLNWQNVEKRIQVLWERRSAHEIKEELDECENKIKALNKKPEFSLLEFIKLNDLLGELSEINKKINNHTTKYILKVGRLSTTETIDRLEQLERDYNQYILHVFRGWSEIATNTITLNSSNTCEYIIQLLDYFIKYSGPEMSKEAQELHDAWEKLLPEIRKKEEAYHLLSKQIEDLENSPEDNFSSVNKKLNEAKSLLRKVNLEFNTPSHAPLVLRPFQKELQKLIDRLKSKFDSYLI